jgi:hypothetical protein
MKSDPQGTVRWFATKSWGAPICESSKRIDIPLDKSCAYCTAQFDSESEGVRLPFVGPITTTYAFYHRNCFMEMLGIGKTGEHE